MVHAEGLIEILSNGQLRIPDLSIEDFTHIQIARIALESAAVRLAVPQLGPEELAHLEGFMAQMSHYLSSDHFDRIEQPHREFHRGLVAGAGAELLLKIDDLADRMGRYRWAAGAVVREHWHQRTEEHRAILDAANAGDPEGVAAFLVRQYLSSGRLLAETLGVPDRPQGRQWLEEKILASLPPSVRTAVLKIDQSPERAAPS
jgi:DNA-binding GntR family transcriptional regulator